MLASMTGFGEAHRQIGSVAVAVEVRTINNRHLKLSLRASEGFGALEPEIDKLVREKVRRGTVQINLRVSRVSSEDDYRIDADVLKSYYQQLVDADFDHERVLNKKMIGSEPPPELVGALLSLPGVVADQRQQSTEPKEDWPAIQPVVEQALEALAAMREQEGKALADDLQTNCRVIADQLAGVESRSPEVANNYRERLTDRVNTALGELNVSVEPADLIREVALFADRTDISEETVRLRSHLDQFAAAINLPESSGRKLEFITQEMVREVNTIGSKANDTEISSRVVEMKTALERIREQVQNVE